MKIKFRPLQADEIEVRVGQVTRKGAMLLLYKNARADMNILDETVGIENWQREHYEVKGNMFCRVGIKVTEFAICGENENNVESVEDVWRNEWVWKSDCGVESNTEKEKGEASDSFKRACTNFGIGRELYSAPPIFVPCETIQEGNRYKLADPYMFYGAYVSAIVYSGDLRKINKVEIRNRKGEVLYG